jgi:hypothetical protein
MHRCSVNDGDGFMFVSQSLPIIASHEFRAAQSYTITLSATDTDGDTGTDDLTLTAEASQNNDFLLDPEAG